MYVAQMQAKREEPPEDDDDDDEVRISIKDRQCKHTRAFSRCVLRGWCAAVL